MPDRRIIEHLIELGLMPQLCRRCRFWNRTSVVYGECRVDPKPVQTPGSYGCSRFDPDKED